MRTLEKKEKLRDTRVSTRALLRFSLFGAWIDDIPSVNFQVKGPQDQKKLCALFGHFFYKLCVTADHEHFPRIYDDDFSVKDIKDCEPSVV